MEIAHGQDVSHRIQGNHTPLVIGQFSYVILKALELQYGAVMITRSSKADLLEERLIEFAATIIKFSAKLPRNSPGRHIGLQILRSGTAPAPNYGEARGAESRADFIPQVTGQDSPRSGGFPKMTYEN